MILQRSGSHPSSFVPRVCFPWNPPQSMIISPPNEFRIVDGRGWTSCGAVEVWNGSVSERTGLLQHFIHQDFSVDCQRKAGNGPFSSEKNLLETTGWSSDKLLFFLLGSWSIEEVNASSPIWMVESWFLHPGCQFRCQWKNGLQTHRSFDDRSAWCFLQRSPVVQ